MADDSSNPTKTRNHLAWIGPLVTVAGLLSYFMFFVRFAPLRDFPWVNLPMVVIGVVLSALAVRRRVGLVSLAGLLVSGLTAGLLVFYVFFLSYSLPSTEGVVAEGEVAPAFALQDHQGQVVSLADYQGENLAVVFYRGFW